MVSRVLVCIPFLGAIFKGVWAYSPNYSMQCIYQSKIKPVTIEPDDRVLETPPLAGNLFKQHAI